MSELQLGCDAEFCFINPLTQTLVPAYNLFHDSVEGPGSHGEFAIGLDGHQATAEFRPGISSKPIELITTMASLMEEACVALPVLKDLIWKSGSFYASSSHNDGWAALGAHIHISALKSDVTKFKNKLNTTTLTTIDKVLYFAENLYCMDERSARQSKLSPTDHLNYGIPNYWKIKDISGQNFHIEYKSPSSWLAYPELAYLYLETMRVLVNTLVFGSSENAHELTCRANMLYPSFIDGAGSDTGVINMNESWQCTPEDCLRTLKTFLAKLDNGGIIDASPTLMRSFNFLLDRAKGEAPHPFCQKDTSFLPQWID